MDEPSEVILLRKTNSRKVTRSQEEKMICPDCGAEYDDEDGDADCDNCRPEDQEEILG